MRVKFYGTRGSIATPGESTSRHGGNTACVHIVSRSGTQVLLDIGTGAAMLGRELAAMGQASGHILISHTHWDHIQGFPFFAPLFQPGNEWDIYAPRGLRHSLRDTLAGQMQHTYFPVELEQLGSTIRYHDLVEGNFTVGDIHVTAQYLNHPALTLGYRLRVDGATIVYACDHEPHSRALATDPGDIDGQDRRHAEFLADADLVIHDAQYVASEYAAKIGWGHSTAEYAVAVARSAGVKRLALTHHDPTRTDAMLDALVERLRADAAGPAMHIFAAAEGTEIELSGAGAVVVEPAATVADALVVPAIAAGTILLATSSPQTTEALSDALAKDALPVIVAPQEAAAQMALRAQPALLVLEDIGSGSAAIVNFVRAASPDLPILLVTDGEGGADHASFQDRLVAPFTPSYARARLRAALLRQACRWQPAAKPDDETDRIAALYRLDILDTPPEERFDRITRLAAALLEVPIALLSFVDADRQWFKSSCGLGSSETPRDQSFCAHAVANRAPLIVPDALADDRFADNPAVTGPPRIRFYAGYPLFLAGGQCVGTLCMLDTRPRDLDPRHTGLLRDLAALVVRELEMGMREAA